MTIRRTLAALLVLGLLYLLFWPVPIEPVAWTPPPAPELVGRWQPDTRISGAELLLTELPGPEDIARDRAGYYYTGCVDGVIYRIPPDATRAEAWVRTGGRPLGLAFDSLGNLLVCDADKGLLRIRPDRSVDTLLTHVKGQRLTFTNSLVITREGTLYLTDASGRFALADIERDLLEHRGHARLIRFQPQTGQADVLLDSLYMGNGIAMDPNGRFLLIAETMKYRLRRYWLTGPKAGQLEDIETNLPGFPDNLAPDGRGGFWVGLVSPRSALLDPLLPYPAIRTVVARLPQFPRPTPFGLLLHLDSLGRPGQLYRDTTDRITSIDGAEAFGDTLWLTSPYRNGLARLIVDNR